MLSKIRSFRLRFSLRVVLLAMAVVAILISCRTFIKNSYHRLQIYAIEHHYYKAPSPAELVRAADYHYSELADSGAVSRISKVFTGSGAPDLFEIMKLANLPPHHHIRVRGGLKTRVTVYTTVEYEQAWVEVLESLRP